MPQKVTRHATMHEKLSQETYKGDLLKYETSSRSPKSWYLVRDHSSGRALVLGDFFMNNPRYEDVDGAILLLGKRGGEYVITFDRDYPGPEFEVRLNHINRRMEIKQREKVTGLRVWSQEDVKQERPDYLHDYLADPHMVDAWPDV